MIGLFTLCLLQRNFELEVGLGRKTQCVAWTVVLPQSHSGALIMFHTGAAESSSTSSCEIQYL